MKLRLTVILLLLLLFAAYCYFFFPSLFSELVQLLRDGVYRPHFNSSGVLNFNGKSIHFYIYFLIFIVSILVYGLEVFLKKIKPDLYKNSLPAILILTSFTIYFIVLGIDWIGQERLFQYRKFVYQDKTTEERIMMIFGASYDFAQFCKDHVRGRWGGQLVTDYNLAGTLEPYVLIYQLYPEIDLAVNPLRSLDALVVFNKENSKDYLSQRYPSRVFYDEKSFLAGNSHMMRGSQIQSLEELW